MLNSPNLFTINYMWKQASMTATLNPLTAMPSKLAVAIRDHALVGFVT